MPAGSILVADDDTAIRTVLNQALSRAGYEVRLTGNAATLWRWVSQGEGDLVITDVVMPDENAFDLLPRIKKMRPNLPVIVMSAQNTFMTAIRASERGAYEYLPKPFDLKELIAIVGRALAEPKERVSTPNEDAEMEAIPLVGRSPAMQEIYRVLARLMQTDLTVMITGESGTGKELVARALHDYGKRRNGPFVAVNMAAIPRDLIESELFGHERGAFTGANTRASGRFEQAEGGTLFLDEIGDMPMEAQTRLLRVLQQGEYTTVGGRTPIKTDVRIVAASNKDLRVLIQQGLFREDLFFRLNVVPLRLPPLRERIEDLPDLIRHFFALAGEGRPAAEKARHAGAGADEAAPLAGQRARARKPGAAPRGALSAGRDHRLRHRRRVGATHGQPGCRSPAWRRQSRRRGGGVSLLALPGLPERRAAAGPLSPHPQGDRGAAADGRARRHPWQPDPRRRSARPQPQHVAEEDPGSRYPGLSKRGLAFPERTVAQLPLPKGAEPVRIALAVMADAVGRSPDWTEMFRWNIENGHSAAGRGLRHYLTSRPVIGIMLATFAGGTCKPGPLTRRSAATISSSTADTIIAR
ncbi:nitrogen regulation protein NR(I) [Bradyrhizobium sp. LB7.1]